MAFVRGPLLGRGASASVSLAFHPSLEKLVAVKTSPLRNSRTLQWEQSVLSQLAHRPHIVRCFGGGAATGDGADRYDLLLEYAPGGTLADVVSARGALPEPVARRYLRSILAGVREVHAGGFVHCDLKASNILVSAGCSAVIADFGLARRKDRERDRDRDGCDRGFGGTPMYLAPECVIGGEFGEASDVWAVGCVVVEMLTGRPPWEFEGEAAVEALMLRVGSGGECPRVPEGASEEAGDFLQRCFEKAPARRWTAEMLLGHPFAAVGEGEGVGEGESPTAVLDWGREEWGVRSKGMEVPSGEVEGEAELRVRELATEAGWRESGEGGWVSVRGD